MLPSISHPTTTATSSSSSSLVHSVSSVPSNISVFPSSHLAMDLSSSTLQQHGIQLNSNLRSEIREHLSVHAQPNHTISLMDDSTLYQQQLQQHPNQNHHSAHNTSPVDSFSSEYATLASQPDFKCPSTSCPQHTGFKELLVETPWKDGYTLQCPSCRVYLFACDSCRRLLDSPVEARSIVSPSCSFAPNSPPTSAINSMEQATTSSSSSSSSSSTSTSSSSSSAVQSIPTSSSNSPPPPPLYVYAKCSHCHFLTVLSPALRSLLSLSPALPLPKQVVWSIQSAIDAPKYLKIKTANYMALLSKFKQVSTSDVKSSNSSSDLSQLEQRLLASRDELLKCITLSQSVGSSRPSAPAPTPKTLWGIVLDTDHPGVAPEKKSSSKKFTNAHIKLLKCAHEDEPIQLNMETLNKITRFMEYLPQVENEKRMLLSSYRAVNRLFQTQAQTSSSNQSKSNNQSILPATSVNATTSSTSSSSTVPTVDLASSALRILLNVQVCHFRNCEHRVRQLLAHTLSLLDNINDMLFSLYDSLALLATEVENNHILHLDEPMPKFAHNHPWWQVCEEVRNILSQSSLLPPNSINNGLAPPNSSSMSLFAPSPYFPELTHIISPPLSMPRDSLNVCISLWRLLHVTASETLKLGLGRPAPPSANVHSNQQRNEEKQAEPLQPVHINNGNSGHSYHMNGNSHAIRQKHFPPAAEQKVPEIVIQQVPPPQPSASHNGSVLKHPPPNNVSSLTVPPHSSHLHNGASSSARYHPYARKPS